MFQKYYSDNLISKFIKCLLWDTYVPTVDIWRPGKALISGFTYITYDKYIVKAKEDFTPASGTNDRPKSSHDDKYFTVIGPYVFGDRYDNITTNYQSNSALYDPNTHYYLGQYLRMVRDLKGIDLMPFYNCYNGEMSDKIRITDTDIISNNNKNDGYVTYIVPIKFSKNYAIYFNSAVPFKIIPAYYNGLDVWRVTGTDNKKLNSTTINYCSNTQPYIYKELSFKAGDFKASVTPAAKLVEDYLVLLIQVPKDIKSSLTVIEEPFDPYVEQNGFNTHILNNNSHSIKLPEIYIDTINSDAIKEDGDIDDFTLNKIYKPISDLPLLSGKTSYAFDDKLVEYLLHNVIVKNDKIRDNILRVQKALSSNKAKKKLGEDNYYSAKFKRDIWDSNLRAYIYNLVTQKYNTPLSFNVNGFVDKDVEFIIDQYKDINEEWGE